MNAAGESHARPGSERAFRWAILLVWILVYLHCLAQAGWQLSTGGGFMSTGFPGLDVLNRHGAAIPVLVNQGDLHRLLLDPFINTSLLGVLFTLWVWNALGGMLLGIVGAARSWIVFLGGGAAGAAAHAWQHPSLSFAGSGPTGAILAATGALLFYGLTHRTPLGTAARRRSLGYLIAIVVFTVLLALLTGSDLMAMGTFELSAMLAGFGAGLLLMAAFGIQRIEARAGVVVRGGAVLCLLAFLWAGWVQAPSAFAGNETMRRARDYVSKIEAVERAAWAVKSRHERAGRSRAAQLEATGSQRAALEAALAGVRDLPWLTDFEGHAELTAYLDTFGGFVRLDYGLLSIQIARMKQAFDAYQPFEAAFLREAGIGERTDPTWASAFRR